MVVTKMSPGCNNIVTPLRRRLAGERGRRIPPYGAEALTEGAQVSNGVRTRLNVRLRVLQLFANTQWPFRSAPPVRSDGQSGRVAFLRSWGSSPRARRQFSCEVVGACSARWWHRPHPEPAHV